MHTCLCIILKTVPGHRQDKQGINILNIKWTAPNEMHPSWLQSESECLLIMSENDQWFVERKLGFISRCCPGRQPSLEEGAGWGVNSRNIKAWSWLGDRAYIREGQQEPTLFCQWGQQRHTVRPQPTALRHKMWGSPSNNGSQKRPQTTSQITIKSVTHFINLFGYFQRTWEQCTSCRCFPHLLVQRYQ